MLFLLNLASLGLSLLFIGKAAQVAIKHLTIISRALGWNSFIVAFLILGIATSIPEFLIGINSALDMTPQLSLGNVIGATIVLLTFIVGLTALFTGQVKIDSNFSKKDLYLTDFILLLPLALFYDNYFSRTDAGIVLAAYIGYMFKVYLDRKKTKDPDAESFSNGKLSGHLIIFLGALTLVAFTSKMAVESAEFIAETLSIPLLLMGILVFAVGTNFPELAISLTAIKNKNSSLVGGNILGSAATNSLIISMLGLIHPFKIYEKDLFLVSTFFFTIAVMVFSHFVRSRSEISRAEGFFLVSIYAFFLIFEVMTKLV